MRKIIPSLVCSIDEILAVVITNELKIRLDSCSWFIYMSLFNYSNIYTATLAIAIKHTVRDIERDTHTKETQTQRHGQRKTRSIVMFYFFSYKLPNQIDHDDLNGVNGDVDQQSKWTNKYHFDY